MVRRWDENFSPNFIFQMNKNLTSDLSLLRMMFTNRVSYATTVIPSLFHSLCCEVSRSTAVTEKKLTKIFKLMTTIDYASSSTLLSSAIGISKWYKITIFYGNRWCCTIFVIFLFWEYRAYVWFYIITCNMQLASLNSYIILVQPYGDLFGLKLRIFHLYSVINGPLTTIFYYEMARGILGKIKKKCAEQR